MAFHHQDKKDHDQSKKLLDQSLDALQPNARRSSSRSRKQETSNPAMSSTSNAAVGSEVMRKRSITPPPVPQRTDSLATGKEITSSASLALPPSTNSKETEWSSDEIVVKIFVQDEQTKILDLSRGSSYGLSEQVVERQEQMLHQEPVNPSKAKNEHQVSDLARRKKLEGFAESHDASVKQGQGKRADLGNSKRQQDKAPRKPKIPTKSLTFCSAVASKPKEDSELLYPSQKGQLGVPQRPRERRASCPAVETGVDPSKRGNVRITNMKRFA